MAGREPDKPLVWLHGEVKTPPFSQGGRIEAGTLLRRLQKGEKHQVIDICKQRLRKYDQAAKEQDE